MNRFYKIYLLLALFICSGVSGYSLEENDRAAIHEAIKDYVESWNHRGGKGFGNDFTEDADFVNIVGMHFSGKAEIEFRHIQIL